MEERARERHLAMFRKTLEIIQKELARKVFKSSIDVRSDVEELSENRPRVAFTMNDTVHVTSMSESESAGCLFHVRTRAAAVWVFASGSPKVHIDEQSLICIDHDPSGPRRQFACFTAYCPRVCAFCEEILTKSYKCSACRCGGVHVRYCSKACQRSHWAIHKTVCKSRI